MLAPRLKPTVDVRAMPDGRLVILRSDLIGSDLELEGDTQWIEALFELMDGTRDVAALRAALRSAGLAHDEGVLNEALQELARSGLLEDAAAAERLHPYTRERYSRQIAYFADVASNGAAVQERLERSTVAVLGVGGLGSWAAYALACSGIGHMRLVDGDRVELSNLNRQILFAEGDIGRPKAAAAAQRLGAFSERATFEAVFRRLDSVEAVADVIAGSDLVVDAADWPSGQIDRWVNEAAVRLGIPHLTMSQHPPNLRVGPLYVPGETGCLGCQEAAYRREFPDFEALAAAAPAVVRAATFGPACGVVGALAAAEAVHFLGGTFQPPTLGRALTIDLRDHTRSWTEVPLDPGCRACGGGTR